MSIPKRARGAARPAWPGITRAMVDVPAGGLVLHVPCAGGHLSETLAREGLRVVAVDETHEAVEDARRHCLAALRLGDDELDERVRFGVRPLQSLGFDDATFDAVVAPGLLERLPDSAARRDVLAEVCRVSRGLVIVSHVSQWLGWLRGAAVGPSLPFRALRADLRAAGLSAESILPVRLSLSPTTYVRARRLILPVAPGLAP